MLFEGGDLARDHGTRHPEPAGGGRETAQFRDSQEGGHGVETVHGC
jgi:hypothetical protein